MPVVPAPNIIEIRDFTGGFQPDSPEASLEANALLDVLNLLPDKVTKTPALRKGFAAIATIDPTRKVQTVRHYSYFTQSGTRKNYLMCVATTGQNNVADNVRVYALDLDSGTVTQVSPANKVWASGDGRHWGETINGVYYGGGPKDPMYSWDGTTWKDDAGAHDYKTMVDPSSSIDLNTQVPSDKAFEKGDRVRWSDANNPDAQSYVAITRNHFRKWKTGRKYQKGDKVTIKREWYTGKSWPKSFRCIKKHTADATNRPGDGTGPWQDYWKQLILDDPRDEEQRISGDWRVIPEAATTSVAVWHAHRLWLRYDDLAGLVGKVRVQYSAPSKPKRNSAINEFHWDPRDFSPRDDEMGEGGGWLPDLQRAEPITALFSYGNYLLVFQRNAVYVLSGASEDSWMFRELATVGTVGPRAVVEHDGLVYFVGPAGMFVTDGTQVVPVPGERAQEYIRRRLDGGGNPHVCAWSYDGYVWVSLPGPTGQDPVETLVYDPSTQSFWKQSIVAYDAVRVRKKGKDYVYFVQPNSGVVMVYGDPSTPATDNGAGISWKLRTAWWQFGTIREERRIRRTWVLAKATNAPTIKGFRNFSATEAYSFTLPVATTPTYVEGRWMPDAYAVSFELSGVGPVEVYGFGVDTQPRRIRYHV